MTRWYLSMSIGLPNIMFRRKEDEKIQGSCGQYEMLSTLTRIELSFNIGISDKMADNKEL